jgi:hypothetical protein
MNLRVYVAGASSELDRAELVIRKLREVGVTITLDWTTNVREHGAGNDGGVPDDVLLPVLRADMVEGVGRADLVLMLAGAKSTGKHVELGGAFLTGVEILVSGPVHNEPWLRALGQRFYESDDLAIAAITERLRRW